MADRTGIELARCGSWDLSTGPLTVTPQMLTNAAEQAKAPGFRAPLKLGHTDERNDGEPAFGWLHNLRVEGSGTDSVLLGDVTGMPEWLADVAPSAYPDRSIEGYVSKASDGTDRLAITGLALLGVTPPGMSTIKSWRDLPQALGVAASEAVAFAASFTATSDQTVAPQTPAEPPEIPPNTEEDGIMPDTIPTAGLRERFGFAEDADEASILTAIDAQLETATAPPTVDQIAAAHKLTPEQVTLALAAAKDGKGTPVIPDGKLLIDADQWDDMKVAAAAGAEARKVQLAQERDQVIEQAFRGGKISAAAKPKWVTRWDKDADTTRTDLDALEVVFPVQAAGYAGAPDIDKSSEDELYASLYPTSQEA